VATTTDVAEELIGAAVARGQQALSEYESKRVLAAYGIPIVAEALVRDAAEAVAAAKQLGYPVVVKACSPALMHKSDRGLVKLNLDDDACVEHAVAEIAEAVGDTPLDGYLVQRMVSGRREIIVGGIRDKLFGPCVMLGLGGILVEALGDVTFRLAPLEDRDAEEMVNELRAQRMFESLRGEPAADRHALSQALIAVGRMLLEHPRIAQVDVNPMVLEGARPVAVDALVTLEP
jgi:succinyl-CoA synthetase beta subunit